MPVSSSTFSFITLPLEHAGEATLYRRWQVQYTQEPEKRIIYTPMSPNDRGSDLFDCGFIQELDILVRD